MQLTLKTGSCQESIKSIKKKKHWMTCIIDTTEIVVAGDWMTAMFIEIVIVYIYNPVNVVSNLYNKFIQISDYKENLKKDWLSWNEFFLILLKKCKVLLKHRSVCSFKSLLSKYTTRNMQLSQWTVFNT